MKKKFLLIALFISVILLTACANNNNNSKVVEKNSDGTSTITYTDGSVIGTNGKDFTFLQEDGSSIIYLDNDKTYQYHGTDGSFVSKDSGGSYTIQLPSDDNVILYANGSYLINNADGSSETGSSKEELNKYLISKNFTVFADLDKKVADIVDYVKKNN